jgi:hypothetical protein
MLHLSAGNLYGGMDLEGHEEKVLHGARATLAPGTVRDWVFEHHGVCPSGVTAMLKENNYTVLQLRKGFFRPRLLHPSARVPPSRWEPPNYLATREPNRAARRFKTAGWHCLQGC